MFNHNNSKPVTSFDTIFCNIVVLRKGLSFLLIDKVTKYAFHSDTGI